MLIMIILSSLTAFVLFIGLAWLFLLKCGSSTLEPGHIPDAKMSSSSKRSGNLKYCFFQSLDGTLVTVTGKFLFSIICLNN